MRKIEEKMLEAIERGVSMSDGNTCVEYKYPCSFVYLHGVLIAIVQPNAISITDCEGWRSPTTKSRLNAILRRYTDLHIKQEKGRWFYYIGGCICSSFREQVIKKDFH